MKSKTHHDAGSARDEVDLILARLKLRHLQLVEVLAGAGSLRAAARQLGLAQPVAGLLLREVEHAFGRPLFERSRTGVTPLPAALALVARTRVALATLRVAAEEAAGSGTMEIRLGFVPHALMTHGARLIAALRERVSPLRVQVETADMLGLVSRVLGGELDAAIARLPTPDFAMKLHDSCALFEMVSDPWCVVGRRAGPRARQRRIAAGELTAHDWVLPAPNTLMYNVLRQACLRAGVRAPQATVVVDGLPNSLVMASESDLLTLCSEAMLRHPLAQNLAKIDVGLTFAAAPLALFHLRESAAMPALQALRELVAPPETGAA